MKKIVYVASLLALLALPVAAQSAPAPQQSSTADLLEQAQATKENIFAAYAMLSSSQDDQNRADDNFHAHIDNSSNPNYSDHQLDENNDLMHRAGQDLAAARGNVQAEATYISQAQDNLKNLMASIGPITGVSSPDVVQLSRMPNWAQRTAGTYDFSQDDARSADAYSGHIVIRFYQKDGISFLTASGSINYSKQTGSLQSTHTADITGIRIDRKTKAVYLTGSFVANHQHDDHPNEDANSQYDLVQLTGGMNAGDSIFLSSSGLPCTHQGRQLPLSFTGHTTRLDFPDLY